MTMPSLECPTYGPPANVSVLNRVRNRFGNLRTHSQKCLTQYQSTQQTLRANEKLQTSLLRQKLQENKVKKGKNGKLDAPRPKMAPISDDGDYALMRQAPKRKLPDCENLGYADMHSQQQDPKRMKPDAQPMNNNPDFSQLSVQIVANYGNGSLSDQIKVNLQANRNGTDKDSVSVKVEQDNSRRGQPQNHMNQRPNMHQEPCPPPTEVNEPNPFGGNLSESEALSRDFDDIMEYVDELVHQQPTPMPPPQRVTPPSYSQPHMTSSQNFQSQQSNQQYLVTSQSQIPQPQRQMYPHMTSPVQNMTPPMMQPQPNLGRQCKSEKEEMYHMFRRTPENKPENPGIQRQNSHGIPHPNMSANIMTQQAVQFSGNNFSGNISSQQNISMNMMRQTPNSYPPTMTRQMPTNNSNMTSQHIHRLSQVAHFPTQEAPQHEPPRLFHPPAQNPYKSSSAHLRHIAEKSRHERTRPINIATDPRTTQTLQHYHNEGPNMSQQMNMLNHPISTGSQRLSHMDANMYSRSQQYMQTQQQPGIVMQQSMQQESIMMRQYPVQQSQPPSYSRVPEPHPQHVIPANQPSYPSNGNPQQTWNPRWQQQVTSHNPMHHHRPQITPDQMQRPHINSTVPAPSNYLPELENDLKFIEDIFNDR